MLFSLQWWGEQTQRNFKWRKRWLEEWIVRKPYMRSYPISAQEGNESPKNPHCITLEVSVRLHRRGRSPVRDTNPVVCFLHKTQVMFSFLCTTTSSTINNRCRIRMASLLLSRKYADLWNTVSIVVSTNQFPSVSVRYCIFVMSHSGEKDTQTTGGNGIIDQGKPFKSTQKKGKKEISEWRWLGDE